MKLERPSPPASASVHAIRIPCPSPVHCSGAVFSLLAGIAVLLYRAAVIVAGAGILQRFLSVLLLAFASAGYTHAGPLMDYIRAYDLNDYALGVSVSADQRTPPELASSSSEKKPAWPLLTEVTSRSPIRASYAKKNIRVSPSLA